MASVLLLKNAHVYTPLNIGRLDVLCLEGKISVIGKIDEDAVRNLNADYEILDLNGKSVIPGLIDPHQHFLGGSGELGYCSRTPEIGLSEQVRGGVTTVVGCIGVDTYTRTMPALLAQAKLYNEEGWSAYVWTGGYPVPPTTLTGSVRSDVLLINEVIGVGELALSDLRSSHPSLDELSRIVSEGYNCGLLSGKCGVTHFHMGDGKKYFGPLFDLLENYDIKGSCLYPTHVNRNVELLKQGTELTRRKIFVDFDVCDDDLVPSLEKFMEFNGDLEFLTLSSDASFAAPETLWLQLKEAMRFFQWPLEKALPLVTTNTAKVLKLPHKGRIEQGLDADLVVIDNVSLDITDVIAKGKIFMRDKKIMFSQKCLIHSNRRIEIHGSKKHPS